MHGKKSTLVTGWRGDRRQSEGDRKTVQEAAAGIWVRVEETL